MAAESKPSDQDAQIQEKTISSQSEDLQKKSDGAVHDEAPAENGVDHETESNLNGVANDIPCDEKPASRPIPVSNEADSGSLEEFESNEADSGIEEERPCDAIEADSGTMIEENISEVNEADSGSTVETTEEVQEEAATTEGVSSTDAIMIDTSNLGDTNGDEGKEEKTDKESNSLGSTVAKHYNDISPITKESRKQSRIFHLRNFNNWIKSVVINEFLEKTRRRKRVSEDLNVLDMACGKGGDILKWQKGRIDHIIMADIASKSIEECKERYSKLQRESRGSRHHNRDRLFSAEFFVADCTKKRLNELYKRKGIKLDLSSCQFAFHYSFESYDQADMMLKNLCENLRVGGYFIGTTPDAQKLAKHIKDCKADSFGNSVFNIKPENKESFPLFGSKYMFYLEGVVDCPEFMVYMPLLEKMAAKYHMRLVWKKNFHEIFKEYNHQHASLLAKMSALEQYPATSGQLAGGSESQYKSAKDYVDKKGNRRVGTLSADEWEVAGLYLAFAFEKVDPLRDEKVKPSHRDDRKRSHDDSRHERRRPSESTSKRSRKDHPEEDMYEIKDEVYDDDDKPEDNNRSRSEKSSSKSSSHKHDKERSSRRRSGESKPRRSESTSKSEKPKEEIADSSQKEITKSEEGESCEEESKKTEESCTELTSTSIEEPATETTEAGAEAEAEAEAEVEAEAEAEAETEAEAVVDDSKETESSETTEETIVDSMEQDQTE